MVLTAMAEQGSDEYMQPSSPRLCANGCGFFGYVLRHERDGTKSEGTGTRTRRKRHEKARVRRIMKAGSWHEREEALLGSVAASRSAYVRSAVSGFCLVSKRGVHQDRVLTGLRACEHTSSNPATSNLCSKCFREREVAQQKKVEMHEPKVLEEPQALLPGTSLSTLVAPAGTEKANAQVEAPLPAAQVQTVQSSQQEEDKDEKATIQVHKNRCFSCNKKVGLTGFKCRCGFIFCSAHRYSDKHDCTFDYKSAGRDAIAKANPTVVASKVQKI